MDNRIELQTKLETILGNRHVYYQPPESLKMEYPAIRYSKNNIKSKYADNIKYSNLNLYKITIISNLPDNSVIQNILSLPYSSFDTHYVSDNLNHDVINLYY